MNSGEIVTIVLSAIGGSAVVLFVLGFLARSLIVHLLNKDIEKYKISIARESEIQTEKLRHQLLIDSTEHRVRYELLQPRRVEVALELLALLQSSSHAITRCVVMLEEYSEVGELPRRSALESQEKFDGLVSEHAVLFPKEIEQQLRKVVVGRNKAIVALLNYELERTVHSQNETTMNIGRALDTAKNCAAILDEIQAVEVDLASGLQLILGVESSDSSVQK